MVYFYHRYLCSFFPSLLKTPLLISFPLGTLGVLLLFTFFSCQSLENRNAKLFCSPQMFDLKGFILNFTFFHFSFLKVTIIASHVMFCHHTPTACCSRTRESRTLLDPLLLSPLLDKFWLGLIPSESFSLPGILASSSTLPWIIMLTKDAKLTADPVSRLVIAAELETEEIKSRLLLKP